MTTGMTIGGLARQTGTSVETIRFYEREGLLPAPPRSAGNYRLYTKSHAQQLAFISNCRNLDMALVEIRLLLTFRNDSSADCGAVSRILDEHAGHVAVRIAELESLQKELRRLRKLCRGTKMSGECEILDGLTSELPIRTRQSGHVHGSHSKSPRKRNS